MPTAHDRLLTAAARLFYDRGIAATGIDAVIAEAGVAKMSLYNTFGSKAALVEAYLDARHREWLGLYAARVDGLPADDHRARALAVFDAYVDHAEAAYPHGFRGCGLLNAAAELAADDPGRAAVRRHKEQVEAILAEHAGSLAEHLSFLLEGSMARAGLEGDAGRIAHARTLAGQLLDRG